MKAVAEELAALDLRLNAAFEEMEVAWAIYKDDRRDEEKLARYTAALREANDLWKQIRAKTKP